MNYSEVMNYLEAEAIKEIALKITMASLFNALVQVSPSPRAPHSPRLGLLHKAEALCHIW